MHIIDSSQMLTLDIEEICCLGENKISDTERFVHFANGIKIDPELLFSSNFANTSFDNTQRSIIDYVIFDMLPCFYDINHLKQYGDISFAVTGIGDYTLAAINERVVTMPGATTCLLSGEQSVQFTIDAMIFQAFCRGLVLDASKTLLAAEDDEWENRPFSVAELEQAGMPSGGFCQQNMDGNGSPCSYNTAPQASNLRGIHEVNLCGANASSCATKISTPGPCGANTGACQINSSVGGACATNIGACFSKHSIGTACAANASLCSKNAGIGSVCGANNGVCGAKLSAGTACGAKAGACGADLGGGSACGANAGSCSVKFKPGSGCGAKAGACVVDVGDLCPANAVVCVINVPGDIVGACIINIIPGLPSC